MARTIVSVVVLTFFSLGLGACGARCGDACRHLMNDCGYIDQWQDVDSCITECEGTGENFVDFDERQDYSRHVGCLADKTCSKLDEDPGQCGDPLLIP